MDKLKNHALRKTMVYSLNHDKLVAIKQIILLKAVIFDFPTMGT